MFCPCITVCLVSLHRNSDTLTQTSWELVHNILFHALYWILTWATKCPLAIQWEDCLLGQSPQGTESRGMTIKKKKKKKRGMTIPWVNLVCSKGCLNIVNTWTFWNCLPSRVKRRTQFYNCTKNTTHRAYNKIFGLNSKSKFSLNSCVFLAKLLDIVKWIHIPGGKDSNQAWSERNIFEITGK